jgi:hypothetical protein
MGLRTISASKYQARFRFTSRAVSGIEGMREVAADADAQIGPTLRMTALLRRRPFPGPRPTISKMERVAQLPQISR